jgi:uncharacterized protein
VPGTGVAVNIALVLVGTAVGLLAGKLITDRFRKIMFAALGLATASIGASMVVGGLAAADKTGARYAVLVLVASLVVGGLAGEAIGIEAGLERFGHWLRRVVYKLPFLREGEGSEHAMVEGFVVASLLYCVGTMTVVGSIQDGLGKPDLLVLKALLDGVASVALASTLGIGVGFSVIPILLVQGAIAFGAHWVGPYLTADVIREMSTVGGTLIFAIGLDLMDIKRLPVGNLMPAVFVAALLGAFFR